MDKLRELAEAATPGPWEATDGVVWIDNYHRATNPAARRYYLRRALERGVAAKAWPTAPVVRVQ